MDINDRDADFEKSTKRLQVLKEGWKTISSKKTEILTEDAKAVQAQLKKKNAPTSHKAVHVLEEIDDPKLDKDPLADAPGTPPPAPITPDGSPVTPTDVGAATAPPSPEAAAISPTPDATSTPAPTDAPVTPPADAAAVAPAAAPATAEQQATQLFANTALANVPPDILNMSTLSNAVNPDGVFLASIVDATNNNKPYTLLVVPGSDFQAAKGDTPDTFVISKPSPPAEIANAPVTDAGAPPVEIPPADAGAPPAEMPIEEPPKEEPPKEEEPKEEPIAEEKKVEEKKCVEEEKIDESEVRELARDPIMFGKKDWKAMIQKILKEGTEKKTDKKQNLKDQIKKLELEKENEKDQEEKKAIQGEIDGLSDKLKKIEDTEKAESSPARLAAKALAAKSAEKTKEEIKSIKGKHDLTDD